MEKKEVLVIFVLAGLMAGSSLVVPFGLVACPVPLQISSEGFRSVNAYSL